MTKRHFWAYCTCGWITFAANEPFLDQLVRRHLDARTTASSCGIAFSRQTPDERDRWLRGLRERDLELAQAARDDGIPSEVQDLPTANFSRDRRE